MEKVEEFKNLHQKYCHVYMVDGYGHNEEAKIQRKASGYKANEQENP
jgi:hypothetical protein